ncbi:MAG: hypothetical protein E7252_05750 [Lachnospira sp.]|nr:hypothetical protein [Lachnospira sp.]
MKKGIKFLYAPARLFYKSNFIKSTEKSKLDAIGIKDEKIVEEYILAKYSTILGVAIVLIIFLVGAFFVSDTGQQIVTKLARKDYFGGDSNYEIHVKGENIDETITVNVSNRVMEKEQVFEMFDELFEELKVIMLADNDSLLNVRSDLNLVKDLKDGAVKVKWNISDYSLISGTGKLNSANIKETGEMLCLVATLSYEEYYIDYRIDVKVFPPIYTEQESIIHELEKELTAINLKNQNEKDIVLPDRIMGKQLTYSVDKENDLPVLIALSVIILILVYLSFESNIKKLNKERNTQLMLDYSELVSKLTLLIGAGMTIRMAWEKIVTDYRQASRNRRVAYEEMVITYNHLQSGKPEGSAYAEFGKRCRLHEYVKLGMLLEQNVKKGTNDLKVSLQKEAQTAFEDRKNFARKLGEEAGTKLLMPIMLMLLVVLIIIMVPALKMIEM